MVPIRSLLLSLLYSLLRARCGVASEIAVESIQNLHWSQFRAPVESTWSQLYSRFRACCRVHLELAGERIWNLRWSQLRSMPRSLLQSQFGNCCSAHRGVDLESAAELVQGSEWSRFGTCNEVRACCGVDSKPDVESIQSQLLTLLGSRLGDSDLAAEPAAYPARQSTWSVVEPAVEPAVESIRNSLWSRSKTCCQACCAIGPELALKSIRNLQ